MSLTPVAELSGALPPRDKVSEPAIDEDRRYTQALFLREQGRTRGALLLLDEVCRTSPDHAEARQLLFKLALELHSEEHLRAHVEWVLVYHTQHAQFAQACWVYRNLRMSMPQHVLSERSLLQALVAGDKAGEGRVVIDVTKLLLHSYPESPALPRALYASAHVQHGEGRPDLAKATLQNLVTRFPKDSLAQLARKKLAEPR